jgi:hypothetical protein
MAENNPNTKIITYAIGIGAGYFLILKPILIKLGFMQSDAQIKQDLTQTQNIQDYLNQSIITQTPTKSRGEWQIIANNIYNDLYHSGISDNKSDAGMQIARVQNDADFSVLYDTFGQRQEYFFGVPTGGMQDLVQFIIGNLNRTEINKINDNYSRKGIKFRF